MRVQITSKPRWGRHGQKLSSCCTTEGTPDLKSLRKRAFFDSDRLWFMGAFLELSIPYNGMKIPSEHDFGGAIAWNRAMLTCSTPNSNRRCFGRWDCLGQLAIFRVKYGWYMVVHVSLFMLSWLFIIPGPPFPLWQQLRQRIGKTERIKMMVGFDWMSFY